MMRDGGRMLKPSSQKGSQMTRQEVIGAEERHTRLLGLALISVLG